MKKIKFLFILMLFLGIGDGHAFYDIGDTSNFSSTIGDSNYCGIDDGHAFYGIDNGGVNFTG